MSERFSRPFGVTPLMVEYSKTGKEETLLKVKSMFIQFWILNKSTLGGKPYNIYQLSAFLEVPVSFVNNYLVENLLSSRIWNEDTREDVFNAVIGQSISWVLEDRLDIQNQVDILKNSQGQSYKPFISSELTKALGLKLSSSNTLQSVIKGLSTNSINIFNNNENTVEANQGFSMEEAMEIIQGQLSGVSKERLIEEAEYELIQDMKELPEVVATKQVGLNTDKEGLSFKKPELTEAMDNYKGAIEDFNETHHEIRREIELQIDPDEEDPELDIYPG